MANRSFNRKQSLEKEVKELYCKISIGSSGAPTLVSGSSYGMASITRNSAGDYTLVLQDNYVSLKFVEAIFLSSTAQDIRVQLKSETVSTTKQINFMTLTGASATDPSSGQVLLLKIEVKNTSVA
jgi:hypothetical protein